MDVLVTVEETPDTATSTSATNIMTDYTANAKVTDNGSIVRLMDLCGDGFLNDGSSRPIQASALSGNSKYGYIADELSKSDGTFDNPVVVTISAASNWDYLTLMLCDSQNNYLQKVVENPTWSGGSTTVTINQFTPNERLHIAKVSLGKAWQFDKESLTSASLQLRGVNTNLEIGDWNLEGSECEFNAYVGADGDRYISIFSRMEKYSEIGFTCGYAEDMSDLRRFYLTEATYDSEDKTLKIKGCDATLAFLDGDYAGKYIPGTYADVRQNHYNAIKQIITDSGITPEESGTVPSGSGSTASNLFFENKSKRNIIAEAVALYRDPDDYCITYRDGGIPELIAGDVETTWTIDEEDVAEFTTEIEMNVKEYDAILLTYSVSDVVEELASQTDCVSGQEYILDVEPFYSISSVTSDNGGTGTASAITPYRIKLVCTHSGNLTVNGKKIIESTTSSDNPKQIVDNTQRGITVDLDELMKFNAGTSITAAAITNLLQASNLKYKFKWRGNYHIRPYDLVHMKRVSSGNRFPNNDLLPNDLIYPQGGEEMIMRITSVSYDFTGGGLVSEIEARRCS